jgi:hypothetical protein
MTNDLPLNRGAALLREAGSITDIAAELGVTPRVVSSWRAGKIPGDENQAKLAASFSIPRTAWAQSAAVELEQETPYDDPPWLVDLYRAHFEWLHPTALLTAELLAAAEHTDELVTVGRLAAEAKARHPELWAEVERAELALGRALATDCVADPHALAFLSMVS